MHPILSILAVVVGVAFLWVAFVFVWYGDDWREYTPLWLPFALIGLSILTGAGLAIGGVIV